MDDWYPFLGGGILLVLGLLFYLRARASRVLLRCTVCKEEQQVELMDPTQRCNTCGAPMERVGGSHA